MARANCSSETETTRSQRINRISRMSNVVLQLDCLKIVYYRPIPVDDERANLLLVGRGDLWRHPQEPSLRIYQHQRQPGIESYTRPLAYLKRGPALSECLTPAETNCSMKVDDSGKPRHGEDVIKVLT